MAIIDRNLVTMKPCFTAMSGTRTEPDHNHEDSPALRVDTHVIVCLVATRRGRQQDRLRRLFEPAETDDDSRTVSGAATAARIIPGPEYSALIGLGTHGSRPRHSLIRVAKVSRWRLRRQAVQGCVCHIPTDLRALGRWCCANPKDSLNGVASTPVQQCSRSEATPRSGRRTWLAARPRDGMMHRGAKPALARFVTPVTRLSRRVIPRCLARSFRGITQTPSQQVKQAPVIPPD